MQHILLLLSNYHWHCPQYVAELESAFFFGGYNLSHPSKEGWSYLLLSSTNGILFLLLRFTSLLSLFGKLVLKLTFKEYFDQQLLLCCENRESSPFRLLFVL